MKFFLTQGSLVGSALLLLSIEDNLRVEDQSVFLTTVTHEGRLSFISAFLPQSLLLFVFCERL